MQITWHLTETVYKRYDIGAEAGATKAGIKLREFAVRQSKFANKFANKNGEQLYADADGDARNCLN